MTNQILLVTFWHQIGTAIAAQCGLFVFGSLRLISAVENYVAPTDIALDMTHSSFTGLPTQARQVIMMFYAELVMYREDDVPSRATFLKKYVY